MLKLEMQLMNTTKYIALLLNSYFISEHDGKNSVDWGDIPFL